MHFKRQPLYREQVLTPMENWEDWWHPCAGTFLVWDDKKKAIEAASDLLKWGTDDPDNHTRRFHGIRVIDATISDGVKRLVAWDSFADPREVTR